MNKFILEYCTGEYEEHMTHHVSIIADSKEAIYETLKTIAYEVEDEYDGVEKFGHFFYK